ncbi:MAG TPA: universal stress protein [Euzebyales bacterium]
MAATMSHVLVALDGSARDREVVDVAARVATTTGVSLALVLPHTPKVTARLADFAAGEEITPADAAEAYVDLLAEPVRDAGVPTAAITVPADDAASALSAYADRHHSAVILAAAGTRPALRRSLAERLARISSTPLIVVPAQFDGSATAAA